MAKSAFHIAAKSIDDQTVIPTAAVEIGCCVGYDGNQIAAAAGDIRGIAKSNGSAGVALNIAVMGTVPARVGAAIATVGSKLTSDAQGRLVTAATGEPVFARALQTAAAADQFIEVFITRDGVA